MDRNTIIGFSLIFMVLMGYYWYTAPSPAEQAKMQHVQDSLAQIQVAKQNEQLKLDSISKAQEKAVDTAIADKSDFAAHVQGKGTEIEISNANLQMSINTKGGAVSRVILKKYRRADSSILELLQPNTTSQSWIWNDQNGNQLSSSNYIWEVSKKTNQQVDLTLKISDSSYIQQSYILHDTNQFVVDYTVTVHGMSNFIRHGNSDFKLDWTAELTKQEKDMKWEQQNSTVVYKMPGENPDKIKATEPTSEVIKNKLQWFGYKQQYFSALLVNKAEFSTDSKLSWEKPNDPTKQVKKMNAQVFIDYNGEPEKQIKLAYYFGPNHFKTLQTSYVGMPDAQLERIIPMGWGIFGWVNRYVVVPVFSMLDGVIGNMGIIILVLTLIIKAILLPLVYRSYISTAKMRILKPEIDEIKEKYGNDMQKVQTENMALYKKAGVSPLSGCVPMLLQMPILFAMFQFFPNAFELRQKAFLWSMDLSRYDSIFDFGGYSIPFYGDHVSLFTLMMTASTLIYTHLNNQISGVSGQMKYIGYIMPIIFLGMLNDYASGLTWYYFVSNMITFTQQWVIRKTVDDKKLHAQIAENKKKPVKKSGFQQRMEEAMKASQQRNRKK